jgi:hypothetical protein
LVRTAERAVGAAHISPGLPLGPGQRESELFRNGCRGRRGQDDDRG